jgi:RHS repeat-associated protein
VTVSTSAPADAQAPAISGPTTTGSTLTADPGQWAGTEPISYSYQWSTCSYQDAVLGDGATGYWRFGDDSGQQVAADSTGNHNDGTVDALGASTTQGVFGATGALTGDGDTAALLNAGQEIVVNDATDLDSPSGYTIELWLKPSSAIPPAGTALLATAFTSGGGGRFELYETSTGALSWLISASGGNVAATSTTKLLDPTHWYYIVATVGQASSHIYIDGALVGSATYTGTLSTTTAALHFGANFNAPNGVSATLDEAAYYPSALTQAQISAHLSAQSCTALSGETNATHTVSATDAGKRLSVTLTANNVAGQATASSPTFQIGGNDLPTNVTRPAVSGDWSIGGSGVQTDDGTWSSSTPLTYSYQWQRCTYAQTIVADHPDAYWPLDETGGPTVKDLSGNDVDGTATAVNFGVPGGLGQGDGSAVAIGGTGSGITVPATTVLNNGNTISIEAWVRLPSTTATQYIVDKGFYQTYTYDSGGNITGTVDHGDFQLLVDRFGEIRLDRSDSADTMLVESSVLWPTDGAFHYVVVTRAVGTYHIYLDGVDVTGSHPGGPSFENTTEPLEIGEVGMHTGPDGSTAGGGNYFTGAIDDLAIYPTALTTQQVAAHHNAGLAPCTDISGQTSSDYTVSSDDVGAQVRAEVQATNSGGTATASSLGTYIGTTPATGQLQPLDGANVQTITPQLVRVGLEPSDDYEFELSNNRDFATVPGQWVRDSAWLSGQNYYTVPTTWGLKNGNSYWWHVRTRSNNVVSSWEGPSELNVEFAPSGVPSYWAMWKSGPLAVNLANGNLVVTPPTPSYPTATGTMAFSLVYNSLDTVSNGWAWGWLAMGGDQFATPPTLVDFGALGGENIVVATWKDGSVGVYNRVGSSSIYTSPAGDDSTLRTDGGSPAGSYTLTDASGDIYVYGPANTTTGQAALQSSEVIDAQAGKAKLTYTLDSYNRITSITDDAGRRLTLTWPVSGCTGNGCFLAVLGPDGTTWKYVTGSSGLLTSITDGTRTLDSFTYDSSHRLIKIQNADDLDSTHASPGYNSNHSIQITYDSAGRVSQISEGPITGQVPTTSTTSFDYHPVVYTTPCAPPQLCSLNTYPTHAYHHIPSDGYPWDRNYNPLGSELAAGSQRDAAGYTVVTAPNLQGTTTTYYDGLNHPVETIDALGRITQEEYNAKNQLLWSEDADGNPTDYGYNPVTDQLLSVSGPPPSPGTSRPVTYNRYDEMSVGTPTVSGQPLQGLQGAYYSNPNLSGRPTATRTDTTVNFSWGAGGPATLPGVTSNFSVRWSGLLDVPQNGSYTLMTGATSGTRLTIDGGQAISNWKDQPLTLVSSQPIALTKGEHQITLDYYVKTSTADVQLEWRCPGCGTPIATEVIPTDNLLPNWENQTSTVSPGGKVSFSHFAAPWAGHPDYTLALLDTSDPVSPANDPTTSFNYDSYGRVTKKVMPDGNADRTIDANGDLSGTADSRYATNDTYYGPGDTVSPPASCPSGMGGPYNQAEQLKSTNTYGLAAVTLVYDNGGNTIAMTNGLGTTCSHYDAEKRLQWTQAPGDTQQTTDTYDPAGNVMNVGNANGTVSTNYDEAGRTIKTTDASGAAVTTNYDPDGNAMSRIATPTVGEASYTTSYTYDHTDKPTSETDPTGLVYGFYYDHLGNLRATQYPNGTFSWTDTNPDGWVTDVFNRHGALIGNETSAPADSSPIVDYTYSNSQDGQKTKETRSGGGLATRVTNYVYDSLGRLQQVTLPSGTVRVYNFDLDSNRTSIVEDGKTVATYAYNPATTPGVDELTSVASGGTTTRYGYTTDGQVKSRGNDTLSWDGWARTTGGTYGGTAISYAYDPSGSLLTRTSAGVITQYLLGDSYETDGSGTIDTSYVDGPAGAPAQYQGPPVTGSTITYLYYSGHGDLAAEANASGVRTASHTYDPFGAPLDTPPANKTVHRFTGRWAKQYDTTSSLVLMGARPYDPSLGRFVEVDPVPGGSLNNYDYAGQDPVNNYDLDGRSCGPGQTGDKLVPDLDFKPACDFHDACYGGKGKLLGKFRSACDDQFLHKMVGICKSKYGAFDPTRYGCLLTAGTFYTAVIGPGSAYSGYKKGQTEECERRGYSNAGCKNWIGHTNGL